MDIDNLRVGQRFDIELAKALENTQVFLCVIGQCWLTLLQARHAAGKRDFVIIDPTGVLWRIGQTTAAAGQAAQPADNL
jgi:hypothetical protein